MKNIYGKFGTTYDALLRVIPNLKEMVNDPKVTSFKLRCPAHVVGKGRNKVFVFGDDPYKDAYMPLSVNILRRNGDEVFISIAHNFLMNGDVVPDPDVELRIDFNMGIVDPMAIQHASGHYSRVYANEERTLVRRAVQADLMSFLAMWFRNLRQQGHVFDPKSVTK